MKIIKLNNLKLNYFKGIEKFDLKLDGKNAKIFGKNASGKTTIEDAFNWILFDKDSQNKSPSGFGIKTKIDGKEISKIDHSVEVVLDVDDIEVSLKKVYKEVWRKERGKLSSEFSGHTTDYFIDQVPMKKKEYIEYIENLVSEDVFKLVTNPRYFNEVLEWKERRNLLIEKAGDITDEDVIASDESLMQLLGVLNGKSIEDHKKIISLRRRDINNEIKSISIRVDETNHNKPERPELNETDLEDQIKEHDTKIEAEQTKINNVKNGSEVSDIRKTINELQIKQDNLKAQHERDQQQGTYKIEARLTEEKTNLNLLRDSVRPLVQTVKTDNEMIEFNKEQMNKLRMNYAELNKKSDEISSQAFDEHSKSCPTCSQILPEDEIEKAKASFNKNKSDELDVIAEELKDINKKGVNLKAEVETSEEEVKKTEKEIEKITQQAKKKTSDIEKLEKEVDSAKELIQNVEDNNTFKDLNEQIKEQENKIEEINKSVENVITEHNESLRVLKDVKSSLELDLRRIEQTKEADVRIKQLEDSERTLSLEFEQLEKELFLTEEFTKRKVDMLNEKINSQFKYARFNLFEEAINGGLTEVCETTYKGVEYSKGLNTGAKIKVGLDIINTLSEHYKIKAPIFIDNFESVTEDIETDSQLIKLIVSADDKKLRVELE